jgi:O-antigen ligase
MPTAIYDSQIQWATILCIGIYYVTFTVLKSRIFATRFFHFNNPDLWLFIVILIGAFSYSLGYEKAARSEQMLLFLAGATLGKGANLWASSSTQLSQVRRAIFLFLAMLAAACFLQSKDSNILQNKYYDHLRWGGLWGDPNIFGLLMGVGVVLAIGLISGDWYLMYGKIKRSLFSLLLLATAIYMGHGLLHSYSRGAWLGTACALVFLILKNEVRTKKSEAKGLLLTLHKSWFLKIWHLTAVILFSTAILLYYQYQSADWSLARRALSLTNTNDFSWRNRVAAWKGALQITAEHPWFGNGWNQHRLLYEHYYLPPKLDESSAIVTNNYLILGDALGIPALFCFGMYLWLSLTRKSENVEVDGLQTTCRSGTIVLLVGFWFDGGLFKLATASTFWILLELSRVQVNEMVTNAEARITPIVAS